MWILLRIPARANNTARDGLRRGGLLVKAKCATRKHRSRIVISRLYAIVSRTYNHVARQLRWVRSFYPAGYLYTATSFAAAQMPNQLSIIMRISVVVDNSAHLYRLLIRRENNTEANSHHC